MPHPDLEIFGEFVADAEAVPYFSKWASANKNGDAPKWRAFRDELLAGRNAAVPTMATRYGQSLVDAGRQHMSITRLIGTMTPPPPEPPEPDAYFVADYQSGTFEDWALLFSYAGDGTHDPNASQTPDGRVSVVANPDGAGNVARFEVRNADPPWPPKTDSHKSEARSVASDTWDKAAVAYGDIRWFSTRVYLPYNGTEKFEWGHGGEDYTVLLELHTASPSQWSAFNFAWGPWEIGSSPPDVNLWAHFHVYGGTFPETTFFRDIHLYQVTDGSGNRVMANHNRWIEIVWGMKFNADSTGWIEVWVDGQNVYPRTNGPTMWVGDFGMYLKHGLYISTDSTLPETGRSVVYFGRTTIGYERPF